MNPEFIRRVIDELCELWDVEPETTPSYRPEVDVHRAVAITTQTHHAVRMARTVLLIDDNTTGIEMVPSVRLVLECAVTAAWLLVNPGSGHTLLRDGADQRKKALDHIRELGEDTSPGYEQSLGTLKALEGVEGARSFIFKQRCDSLIGGDGIYVLFRVLSAESHAGMGVSNYFCHNDTQSPIG